MTEPVSPISRLLANATFEVIPMKSTREKAQALPAGAEVSVTASPAKGMAATVELSVGLAEDGFTAIPHISARLTKTRAELEGMVGDLDRAGIDRAFVVAGDADDPGDFVDAVELLAALESMGHPFRRIGITGYPEGHPVIADHQLDRALAEKQRHADYIATQLCFDPARILSWARGIRAAGVTLPISLGVTGSVDTVKLMTIGARIGVGQSLRYLRKNRRAVAKLLTPGRTTPDAVIAGVAPEAESLGITGLHIFTFNAIEETASWYREALT